MQIVQLWAELAYETETLDDELEKTILLHSQTSPEKIGLDDQHLESVSRKRDALTREKQTRQTEIQKYLASIKVLWEKLQIDNQYREAFLGSVRGVGSFVTQNVPQPSELYRLKQTSV